MNNVLIYFCANVQILIRPGTIVFTKSDLTPGEKRRISLRFDRTPDVSPIFLQDSTARLTQAPYFSKIRLRTRREVESWGNATHPLSYKAMKQSSTLGSRRSMLTSA